MAINPVVTTRQWYSYANVAFTPSTADDCIRKYLWNWKQLLTVNHSTLGGTAGPEGARPSSANWTVEASCDGTNYGPTDYWTGIDKVNGGAAGTAHSWIIMKSPTTFGNYGSVTGQGPVWMMIAYTTYSGALSNNRAMVYFSREAFVQHPTTPTLIRPTSPKEFTIPFSTTAGYHPRLHNDAVYGSPRYMHMSIDAHGQWYMIWSRGGGGVSASFFCLENINSDDRDMYRLSIAIERIGHPYHHMQRRWDGSAKVQDLSNNNGHTNGGIGRWVFGGCLQSSATPQIGLYDGNQANIIANSNLVYATWNGTNSTAGSNLETIGSNHVQDQDGYYIALPKYMLDGGAGYPASRSTNYPQWRGQIPDLWEIPDVPAVGSSYPSASNQTHVVLPATVSYEGKYIVPMSVQIIV